MALLFAACTSHDGDDLTPPADDSNAIRFATQLGSTTTRASIDNLDALKMTGFSVFAYFTDASEWDVATSGLLSDDEDYPTPDLMFNQPVRWQLLYVTPGGENMEGWQYAPLKYWPNYTNNSLARKRYVSFFAYAPYTEEGLPDATDKSPHINFTLGAPGTQTDLIYASCIDATRNGNGLIEVSGSDATYQNVPLRFEHALSFLDIYVQRLYDEDTFSGRTPEGETTKLFVNQLSFTASPALASAGRLSLTDGSWTTTATSAAAHTYDYTMFDDHLSGTTDPALVASQELNKWALDGYGVDDRERQLVPASKAIMLIPQTITLTPTLTYSLVTQDNTLALSTLTDDSGNKYTRMVTEATGNPVSISLKSGKRYKLIIRIGVEHISFEVVSVEDWDFPMRFTTGTDEWDHDRQDVILNEED